MFEHRRTRDKSMLCYLLAIVIASACQLLVAAELPAYRLSEHVIPRHYNLSIDTDLDNFVFNGQVDIRIRCKSPTDTIKLHSVDLSIDDEAVTLRKYADKKEVAVSGIQLDSENDFLIVKFVKALDANSTYLLHISFSGNLTDRLAGYYRSSYEDKTTGTTKWLASTQFESIDARRAFPCFDEPAMKAKYRIWLGHRENLSSISNMPLATTHPRRDKPGWVWDEYQESVSMSTYLVAFVVSEFNYTQSEPEHNDVLFRVWARPDALDQAEFARKYGPKFLIFYEDLFGGRYPLPKQDLVAIPDFSAGAMENWGLITFRETYILVDEKTSSVSYRHEVADTLAHELAHQWFGNLVTMRWWTDLWLNEGFATYVASLAVQNQFPEWKTFQLDVAENLFAVLTLDALKTSHPVSVPIGHPHEVDQIFDEISYSKGSLLLHMMRSFLGHDVFKAGIRAYIRQFAYRNTEQDDLWASLTEAAADKAGVLPPGRTVKDVMDKWTLQTGYPVLTVTRDGGKLTVSQKRFLAIKPIPGEEVEGCWWVPLTYTTARDTKLGSHWLGCETPELTIDTGAGPDDWIILNNNASGIYRVNYDAHSWKLLADALHGPGMGEIHELNRLLLVADAMALAQVGALEYSSAFRLLKYIRREPAYLPWTAATSALRHIKNILWRTDKFHEFKKMVQELLSDIYLQFSDLREMPTGVEAVKHKTLVTAWFCYYGVGNCSRDAVQLFNEWMASSDNRIPNDLRSTVYCEGVKRGGEAEWQYVWQQYQGTSIASEKDTLLYALACTRHKDLLLRLLEWTLQPSSAIRRQDAVRVFSLVATESRLGYRLALNYLKQNVQQIHDYHAPNTQEMGFYANSVLQKMVFPRELDEMKTFLKEHAKLFEKSQLKVKQGLETAETNLAWMRDFYANISSAFNS